MTGNPNALLLDRSTPLNTAYAFIEIAYTTSDTCTLRHQSGEFYCWTGTHYKKVDSDSIRSRIYSFLDGADHVTGSSLSVPFNPTSRRVTEVLDALKAASNLDSSISPPVWLGERKEPPPLEIVACQNGLLHIPSRKLLSHTPEFFTLNAVPFSYQPNAAAPREWLLFLASLFGNDAGAINVLQEIFGYCLSFDTQQQKMFLIVGPKRSGKGTIARVLTSLLGPENVANPTLASIQTNFGLSPLIGKPLAIFPDARLGGRADQQVIVERLLSVSGEDSRTV
jgi:putative DNA primase/helicase